MPDVPIPPRMRKLDRDHRGYPIPYLVFRDKHGRPHFTINDEGRRIEVLTRDLCSICGQPLGGPRWFTGGARSAFDNPDHDPPIQGVYSDPPMHEGCLRYAMVVCPYIASPRYERRIDARTVRPEDRETHRIFIDVSQIPERPPIFVNVLARSHEWHMSRDHGLICRPKKPYLKVEFWRHGQQISQAEGSRIAAEIMEMPLPKLRIPRLR